MKQLDNKKFGKFILENRKKKNYTQKDIAERLFVSTQAVSKWERGLSFPDINLLVPLAEILDVKISELLDTDNKEDDLKELVDTLVSISENNPEKKKNLLKKKLLIFIASYMIIGIEYFILIRYFSFNIKNILTPLILGIIFSISTWFFVDDKLPKYYDENKISFVSNGFFRIKIIGVSFNNSNWYKVITYLRFWSLAIMIISPIGYILFKDNIYSNFIYLASMFLPIYILAKKYE